MKCPDLAISVLIDCDEGYYCLEGDAAPRLCDEGTITIGTTATDHDENEDCTVLTKNDWIKTVSIFGTIDDGYEANEIPDGDADGAAETWTVPVKRGNLCAIGQYCQGGDTNDCGPGKYCPEEKMIADGNDCDAGFYCQGAATNRRPTEIALQMGDRCLEGQFCIAGVDAGTDCAKGSYSSARGLTVSTECTECPNGFQCLTDGMLLTDV